MKLYFTCPTRKEIFSTEDYSLQHGHSVVISKDGAKELQGTVSLNSACPYCGEKHHFDVKDVACPITREDESDEK